MSNSMFSDDNENEWTDICRICLGPDEEGFELAKPCRCAGTIAHVHQKCLEATIAEKRSNKCPVCGYEYVFKPKYADNTPDHLSTTDVVSGLVLRAANKWIPLFLRLLLVLAVWLGMLPLITSYMYQAWMHYPTSIKTRIDSKLVFSDIVSGLMITATIVISFLSLMSLFEHFRFNWQPRRQRQQQEEAEEREAQAENARHDDDAAAAVVAAAAELEQERRNLQQREQLNNFLHVRNLHLHQQQNGNENNDLHQQLLLHSNDEIDDYMDYGDKKDRKKSAKNETDEDQIINEEFFQLLHNAGFEYDEKIENGFVTTEEEEDESYYALKQSNKDKSTKLPSSNKINPQNRKMIYHQHDNGMDDMDTIDHDDGNVCGINNKIDEDENDIKEDADDTLNLSHHRKSMQIGVMDEGQVIISEAIDMPSSFNTLSPQHLKQHDEQEQNLLAQHQHDDITATPNDGFLSRNSSFYSLNDDNDDILDHNESTWIQHKTELLQEEAPKQRYIGTPRRRKGKRDMLKKEIYDNIDIDSDENDNNFDRRKRDNPDGIMDEIRAMKPEFQHNGKELEHHSPSRQTNGILRNKKDSKSSKTKSIHNQLLHLQQDNDEDDKDNLEEEFERMMRLQEEAEQQEEDFLNFDQNDNFDGDNGMDRNGGAVGNNRFEPQFEPLDPAPRANDDQMDMEGAMPIDELIGLRGPISSLFRNLMWFVAFNTSYLGVFVYIPSIMGSLTYSQFSRSRPLSYLSSVFFKHLLLLPFTRFSTENENPAELHSMLTLLDEQAKSQNNVLKPDDIGYICLGYLTLAVSIFLLHLMVERCLNYSKELSHSTSQHGHNNIRHNNLNPHDVRHNMNPHNVHIGMGRNMNGNNENRNVEDADLTMVVVKKLGDLMECAAAITKVVILIFLKMVFLPFLLGLWLDISTLELYKSSISERVVFAGVDIVGFFLLHWLVGITFMLIVTVSVLQFREVLHPDIMAKIIRPQESQTDMIANLLQDDGWTHVKRIVPSIGIYAVLLMLHIWLPAMILSKFDLDHYIPLFRPKVWYVLSKQLALPLELVTFHLSMLSMLERHKNKIGESQHAFLLNICRKLNLTDKLLPRAIEKFKLRTMNGILIAPKIELSDGKLKATCIDPFWENLLIMHENNGPTDEYIESYLANFPSPRASERYLDFVSKDGEASEPFHSYIALPIFEKSRTSNIPISKKLLSPRMGKFRFRKGESSDRLLSIEIWQEVVGDPVPRPPEGWDYLGDNGGAVEQGRWAWGKEAKSNIETSLAKRDHFFPTLVRNGKAVKPWMSTQFWSSLIPLVIKVLLLVISCWTTVTCCVYGAISVPIAVGRSLHKLFGVPDCYVHDPCVFMIGSCLFYPIMLKANNFICYKAARNQRGIRDCFRRILALTIIPRKKFMLIFVTGCLWFIVAPLILGLSYDFFFLANNMKFDNTVIDLSHLAHVWAIGMVLLHTWAVLFHIGAFEQKFWLQIGRLPVNDNINNANPVGNGQNNDQHENDPCEEPPHEGPLHNFIQTISAIFTKEEWDKVDKETLLDNSLIPIIKGLLFALVVPLAASSGCTIFAQHFDIIMHISSRQELYCLFTTICYVGILLNSYRHEIRIWFKSAHDAARDQRYLIGQILLNREP